LSVNVLSIFYHQVTLIKTANKKKGIKSSTFYNATKYGVEIVDYNKTKYCRKKEIEKN
jgi:hypothetical protein